MASSVAVGRAFEAAVGRRLAHLGCRLAPTGGAFDQCIDLAGEWAFAFPYCAPAPWPGDAVRLGCTRAAGAGAAPSAILRVPVVVQCKATRSPAGVATMREFAHAVAARFPEGTLAVLACTGGFAWRSLRREREWAARDVLLLQMTPDGGIVALQQLRSAAAAETLPVGFSSAPL